MFNDFLIYLFYFNLIGKLLYTFNGLHMFLPEIWATQRFAPAFLIFLIDNMLQL